MMVQNKFDAAELVVNKATDTKLLIGASWYPETWPETEWPRDIERMLELKVSAIRVFEFAWHKFEPQEGKFDFSWAMHVLDLCADAGIAVMVGTPTAAPPAWLTANYPEVLRTRHDGTRATHGRRRHYNHQSKLYREFCAKIVSKMADTFAGHPALHSWQIDNEMGGEDYGTEARAAFHHWLKDHFGKIENLNRAWCLELWSQAYSDYAQIPLANINLNASEIPERHHPSLVLAQIRFNNEAWTSFIKLQCDCIRMHSDRPITTNMTPGLAMDWYKHNRVLDRVGHSLYQDVAHYDWSAMWFERMRCEKNAPFWLIETAPNWAGGGKIWNKHYDERAVYAYTWLTVLMGGSMVLYWQWREHWAGQEVLHGTLVSATGKWRPNAMQIKRVAEEFRKQSDWVLAHPPMPAQVALMFSNENSWAFAIDPIDDNMKYIDHLRSDYYLPLLRQHIWRDVICEDADISGYKVIIMPLMPMISPALRLKIAEWVRNGGYLLLGPFSGTRTQEFTVFTDHEFGGLEELMGCTSATRFTAHLIEHRIKVLFENGSESQTRAWCEAFECTTGQVTAKYSGGYADGSAAVVHNVFGNGNVMTIGCMVDEQAYLSLAKEILENQNLVPVASGSSKVLVIPRSTPDGAIEGYGIVNIDENPQTVTINHSGTCILTGKKISAHRPIELSGLEVMIVEIC